MIFGTHDIIHLTRYGIGNDVYDDMKSVKPRNNYALQKIKNATFKSNLVLVL